MDDPNNKCLTNKILNKFDFHDDHRAMYKYNEARHLAHVFKSYCLDNSLKFKITLEKLTKF